MTVTRSMSMKRRKRSVLEQPSSVERACACVGLWGVRMLVSCCGGGGRRDLRSRPRPPLVLVVLGAGALGRH